MEDCPNAVNYLSENGADQWLLDADVHNISPVKRFCQEFKDSITVYAPEKLKKALGIIEEIKTDTNEEIETTQVQATEEKSFKERVIMAFAILMPGLFKKLNWGLSMSI